MEDTLWSSSQASSNQVGECVLDPVLWPQWNYNFDIQDVDGDDETGWATADVQNAYGDGGSGWPGAGESLFFGDAVAAVDFAQHIDNLISSCDEPLENFSSSNLLETECVAPWPLPAFETLPFQLNVVAAPCVPKQRPFEECVGEFVGISGDLASKRRKKRYAKEERSKVHQVRKVGACIRCRLIKTQCELELPCASCLKACKDPQLGRSLCIRQRLLDARFTMDLWDRASDVNWLRKHINIFREEPRTMKLCVHNGSGLNGVASVWDGGYDGPWINPALLDIKVQNFEPLLGQEDEHTLQVAFFPGGVISVSPQYEAIPPDSLPSIETLESWVIETNKHSKRAFFTPCFHGTFFSLASYYHQCKNKLPLGDLMRKAVRLSSLHALWCCALPLTRSSRDQPVEYASEAVHVQINAIVSQAIVDLEVDILSQLQDLIFGSKGPGKQNMLPIWICLWLLILIYRRTLRFSTQKNRTNRFALAEHMYDMLVSIHSALFRPSSPIGLNWLKCDVFEVFGKDPRITHCMGTLKSELNFICISNSDEENFQQPYDTLLRSLIIENEKRIIEKLRCSSDDTRYRVGELKSSPV